MKRLLALVLAVVMVLSASFSVFALEDVAGTEFEEAINYFFENGVVEGDNGKFLPDGAFTRAAMTKILVGVLGYTEEDAAAAAGETGFEDVDGVASQEWAQGWILIAKEAGIIEGHTATYFGSAENVTVGQLATMLARALDLEFDEASSNPWYASAVEAVVAAGLMEEGVDGAAELKRGEAMGVFYAALDVENAEGETFRANIEGEEEVVVPEKFDVVSATAANLAEIDVVFNAKVDASTVADTNFTLNNSATVYTATVLEDGVTVRLTTQLSNQTSYKVTVAGVKSAEGKDLTVKEASFTTADFTLPVLEKVEFVGPQTAQLTFSEPVSTQDMTATLNNGTYAGVVESGDFTRNITVGFGINLANGTYKVKVTNAVDAANFKMNDTEVEVAYAAQATPVTVTVTAATQTSVSLKFDRPVTFKADAADDFSHTYSAWKANGVVDSDNNSVVGNGNYYTEVKVEFDTYILQPGAVTLNIAGSDKVVDRWSNKLDTAAQALNITVDNTAPEVTAVAATSQTALKVSFSEEVNTDNATWTLVKVSDNSKVAVTPAFVANSKNTAVSLTAVSALSGDYTLTVKGVTDVSLAANKLADYTTTVNVPDVTAMSVVDTAEKVSASKVIYVTFPEAPATTGAYSALDTNNYVVTVNGETLKADEFTASVFSAKVVKLTVTKSGIDNLDEAVTVTVGRIADAAGNVPAAFTLSSALSANEAAGPDIVENSGKMVNGNTVTLQLDKELTGIVPSKFSAEGSDDDSDAQVVAAASFTNKDGKSTITLTLRAGETFANAIYDATNPTAYSTSSVSGVTVTIAADAVTAVTGKKNAELTLSTWSDAMAPEVGRKINEAKVINNVEVTGNTVTVVYTEALDKDYLSKLSYSVSVNGTARSITSVTQDAGTVTVDFGGDAVVSTDSVVVTQNLAVYDADGNAYTPAASWTALYVAAAQ